MEVLDSPRRRCSALILVCVILGVLVPETQAQPLVVTPRCVVGFPAAKNGKAGESTAVSVDGACWVVAVVMPGANAMVPNLRVGSREVKVDKVVHDPVSRLGLIQVAAGILPQSPGWLQSADSCMGTRLQASAPSGVIPCVATGWVKQVGGKILPLALMRVSFDRAVPPSGTPLLDSSGRVAGIVFQAEGSSNNGYAIPAEAVHRVSQDLCRDGRVIRGWLGLSLLAGNQMPKVERVLPGSPAKTGGILPGDVLQAVGSRAIGDYADAVNAFFYLIPGRVVKVKVLRGVEQLEFNLTPVPPKDG